MIPKTQKIELLLGQAAEFVIPVRQKSGEPIEDIESAVIEFVLSRNEQSTDTIPLPTTLDGDEVTAKLSTPKSLEIGPGNWYFACWVTILDNSTPIARGWLNIKNSTRG